MDRIDTELDKLVREELGEEPSQEAIEYARKLYEQYKLPDPSEEETAASEES